MLTMSDRETLEAIADYLAIEYDLDSIDLGRCSDCGAPCERGEALCVNCQLDQTLAETYVSDLGAI